MDKALAAENIFVSSPYIKKEGVELLKAGYETNEAANSKLPAALATFYQQEYPTFTHNALKTSIKLVRRFLRFTIATSFRT
jgi:hypothetical protein